MTTDADVVTVPTQRWTPLAGAPGLEVWHDGGLHRSAGWRATDGTVWLTSPAQTWRLRLTAATESGCALCAVDPTGAADGSDDGAQGAVAVAARDPLVPGHALVLPRRHVAGWLDATDADLLAVARLVRRVARDAVRHGATGVNVLHATGRAAGQSVEHLHVHVLPRRPRDGLDAWPRRVNSEETEEES